MDVDTPALEDAAAGGSADLLSCGAAALGDGPLVHS
jgi:hypothetical protein